MQSIFARLRAAFRRVTGLTRRPTLDARLREEIAFHIEMETGRNLSLGMTVAEARRRALVTFGGRERTSDDARDQLRSRVADELLRDVRFALRGMRRTPGFTLTVVVTLALGIGANATMFGLVDRLMLRPPAHVTNPDQLYVFNLRYQGSSGLQTSQPYGLVTGLREHVPDFSSVTVATSGTSRGRYFPLGRGPTGTRVSGLLVGGNYFTTLGVHPAVGRFFLNDEETLQRAEKLAVLGYGFWQSRFGGRRDAIGQVLELGTDKYTVVGVAPRGFSGTELSDIDVFVPVEAADGLRFAHGADWATSANAQWINIIARLAPGASVDQAAAQATVAARGWMASHMSKPTPENLASLDSETVVLGSVLPSKSLGDSGPQSSEIRISALLAAVALIVLLLACANVANLLLLRALQRRREIAVRLALGVSRRRLIMQLLIEGLVLSAAGAVGALGIATLASGVVRRWLLADQAWSGSGVDMHVLGFTAVAALFTGIITSVVPALQASQPNLTGSLKTGAREGVAQRSRTRTTLLVVQAALAIVLLAGAGLFTQSLRNADSLDMGVDVDHTIVGQINQSSTGLSNAEARRLYDEFETRARALPGVKAVAVSIAVPFGLSWGVTVSVPDRTLPSVERQTYQYAVTPDYFAAAGMHLIAGRAFTDADRANSAPVVIVNETLARRAWPDRPAIGQCLVIEDKTKGCATTVVGVVNDTHRQDLVEDAITQIYRPLDQLPASYTDHTVSFFGYDLIVGARGDADALVEPLRHTMQSVGASVPYPNVRTLREALGSQTRSWSLGARVFSAFGALALVLAAIGLFSVVAFTVRQRRHEFGIRTALGAEPSDLLRLTVTRGLAPVIVGIVTGVILALLAGRFVESLLFNVSAHDPVVLATASGTLLLCAVLASLVPALRASRADPTIALRAE
ncbi:MAG TPA: ABC transporter permease [Gemmatimonadaceae bacterium]|jgi:predicted permease